MSHETIQRNTRKTFSKRGVHSRIMKDEIMTEQILERLTGKMYEVKGQYASTRMNRRTFFKTAARYGLEVGAGIAAVEIAASEIANSYVPKLVPRNLEDEIKREIWKRFSVLPNVDASKTQFIIPAAVKIPDSNNPFAEGTWDDATKIKIGYYFSSDTSGWWNNPAYAYAKYKQGDRLFIFTDGCFITDRTKELAAGYTFDTKDDGNTNWTKNPDDFFIVQGVHPPEVGFGQPPQPPNYNYLWKSTFATEVVKNGLFRWDFDSSENFNEKHFKAYAEIKMSDLLKYPNPNDPSIIGADFGTGEDSSSTYHDMAMSKSNTQLQEIMFADIKVPELSWVDITLIATLGISAWMLYRNKARN